MTNDELTQLFILLHRPIPWDPVPIWWKLNPEQIKQFADVQARFNAKMDEIQNKKITELAKIAGVSKNLIK